MNRLDTGGNGQYLESFLTQSTNVHGPSSACPGACRKYLHSLASTEVLPEKGPNLRAEGNPAAWPEFTHEQPGSQGETRRRLGRPRAGEGKMTYQVRGAPGFLRDPLTAGWGHQGVSPDAGPRGWWVLAGMPGTATVQA